MRTPALPLSEPATAQLGCGTGGFGIAAAVLGADVTLSDQAEFCYPQGEGRARKPQESLLDLASKNVRRNAAKVGRSPIVSKLLWGDLADMSGLPHAKYDVICGADVLLFSEALPELLSTLRHLSIASTIVLIEHTDRGILAEEFPRDLQFFLDAIAADKLWRPVVVRDHGRHITLRLARL